MEINITKFMRDAAPMDYSASAAEIGNDAGPTTWRAAMDDAGDYLHLETVDQLDAMRAHIGAMGAWDDEEIAAMTPQHLNAMFLQCVAGDMREAGIDASTSEQGWADYVAGCEAGRYAGRIMQSRDAGEFLYYLGD